MNILFITEFTPKKERDVFTGGVDARTSTTVRFLKNTHNVQVINRSQHRIFASTFSVFPRFLFQLQAFLQAFLIKADIIEGSNFVTYLPAWGSAKLKGIPAVAWFADVYGNVWFKHFAIFPAVTGWLLERVALKLPWNQVIAMSNSTKRKLIEASIPEDKITIIYGGVETEKLRKLQAQKYLRPTICTICRLVNYKRVNELIMALANLKRDFPSCRLLVIGAGPQEMNLRNLTQTLQLERDVRFLGTLPHDETMTILKRCHLLAMPSVVEGFGLVTVEAMACGVPFVNSRIPATVEITKNGLGGLLFSPEDVNDLEEKIRELLTNKALYQQKQKEGLKLAKQYDWAIIAKQTEEVYRKAMGDRV